MALAATPVAAVRRAVIPARLRDSFLAADEIAKVGAVVRQISAVMAMNLVVTARRLGRVIHVVSGHLISPSEGR
jgi:hypothetical protein